MLNTRADPAQLEGDDARDPRSWLQEESPGNTTRGDVARDRSGKTAAMLAVDTHKPHVQCLVTMDLNMVCAGARKALPWETGDL